MLFAVITTIQKPTPSVFRLAHRLRDTDGQLIVIGDRKGPQDFCGFPDDACPIIFLSLSDQQTGEFALGRSLPIGHYGRKNIGYLKAIASGATCIYETDDDNAPNDDWQVRSEYVASTRLVPKTAEAIWINVYRYFSKELIWPRGLPLDEIRSAVPEALKTEAVVRAPIQQGLVNGSPDVDAIWRLVLDRQFCFDKSSTVLLASGNWCPFNTQSTWWWPVAYPLLYVPSHCSFRMCDIWKSFIAQRCIWELGSGVAFHSAEVEQDRNKHDLIRDFTDELPGYKDNRKIIQVLSKLQLGSGDNQVANNFHRCYEALVQVGIFPAEEMKLVETWLSDLSLAAKMSS